MARQPLSTEEIRKKLTPEEVIKRMSYYVHEVGNGPKTARDLTLEEIENAFRVLFEGQCSEAQVATFLVAMRIKGSSDDERYGLLNILREYNEAPGFEFEDLLDYSGFHDGRDGELHLSPAIALVAAAAGGRVVLTGGQSRNHNTLHRILLQDVLKKLGISPDNLLQEAGRTLQEVRVGFVDTHRVNRVLNNPHLDRIRLEVGLRTPINTMEISLNPANAPYHIRGMYHPRSKEQIARIMARSGIRRGLMISGLAGSGEVPTHKPAEAYEIREGQVRTFTLNPSDYGFAKGKRSDLIAETAGEQARILEGILQGEGEGTLRDMTILNAGLVLYTSEVAPSIEAGIESARQALDSGQPLKLLQAWRKSA